MNREEALTLLKSYVKAENLLKHMFATEAIMKDLARYLHEDEETWALSGLLHDIDFEMTKNDEAKHGVIAQDILKGKVNDTVLHAIRAHNFRDAVDKPTSTIGIALVASDSMSGLLVASALVMPHKKLSEVEVSSIKRKFNDSSFARGSSRERIAISDELGIPRDTFYEIALKAVQGIANVLGL